MVELFELDEVELMKRAGQLEARLAKMQKLPDSLASPDAIKALQDRLGVIRAIFALDTTGEVPH